MKCQIKSVFYFIEQNMNRIFSTRTLNIVIVQHLKMSSVGSIEIAIKEALTKGLNPKHLEVINESYMHSVPKNSETHFKVLVVSDSFDNVPLIKRHRMVNEIVKEKLDGNFVHALSIEAKTVNQWTENYTVEKSPHCKGGFGK